MTSYRVGIPELHYFYVTVEAESESEAVDMARVGDYEDMETELVYIETLPEYEYECEVSE